MNKLIDEFGNENENPVTWCGGGLGGYIKEFTEWLAEKLVNKNISNCRELSIEFYYKLSQRLDTNLLPITINNIIDLYEKGKL